MSSTESSFLELLDAKNLARSASVVFTLMLIIGLLRITYVVRGFNDYTGLYRAVIAYVLSGSAAYYYYALSRRNIRYTYTPFRRVNLLKA